MNTQYEHVHIASITLRQRDIILALLSSNFVPTHVSINNNSWIANSSTEYWAPWRQNQLFSTGNRTILQRISRVIFLSRSTICVLQRFPPVPICHQQRLGSIDLAGISFWAGVLRPFCRELSQAHSANRLQVFPTKNRLMQKSFITTSQRALIPWQFSPNQGSLKKNAHTALASTDSNDSTVVLIKYAVRAFERCQICLWYYIYLWKKLWVSSFEIFRYYWVNCKWNP